MAKFFKYSNNGVVAIITEAVNQKMEERSRLMLECEKKGYPTPQLPPITPVFTFSEPQHGAFKYMTGSYEMLTKLLKHHVVTDGWFWVPFSNGIQWHQDKSATEEIAYMTSLDEVVEAF